jgi:AbrB family looped-hinge helix DNA binding protein
MKGIGAKIASNGRVTIPAEIRRQFGLNIGAKGAFVVNDDGNVSLRWPAFTDIASLAGAAGKPPKPMTWEQMRRIAHEDHAGEKFGGPS